MTAADPWSVLGRELDLWHAAGRVAGMWLRDDDACRPGPRLSHLLDVWDGLPLGLAVIPAMAEETLGPALDRSPAVRVLQHGYSHRNHAPPDRKKAEFGADRPVEEMCAEIRAGWQTIDALFGARAVPVFVPPWNRIDPRVAARLPDCGLALLSVYGERTIEQGNHRVNTHADIIDWHGGRAFVGEAAAIDAIVSHLAARRTGRADPDEPTGILTHHKDHDAGCWDFLTRLAEHGRRHPAVRWLDPGAFPGNDG